MQFSLKTTAAMLPCFLAVSAGQAEPSSRAAEQPSNIIERVLSRQHVILDDSTLITSDIFAETVTIAAGSNVTIYDNITIYAKRIIINGTMESVSTYYVTGKAAPRIVLMAEESIAIRGNMTGGKALSGEHQGEAGQGGTDIILDAPIVFINGIVRAGDGGDGGTAANGGGGGSVIVFGMSVTEDGYDGTIIGGRGGFSGQITPDTIGLAPFVSSGSGGDAVVLSLNTNQNQSTGESRLNELHKIVNQILMNPGLNPSSLLTPDCTDGSRGLKGSSSIAQNGTPGTNGLNASTIPAGGCNPATSGTNGGLGASAVSGTGLTGGVGGKCCVDASSVGGKGGIGGKAGSAKAGQGGFGGSGGNGAGGCSPADGANGGNGGNVQSGDGGSGGNGGLGMAAGGAAGSGGTASFVSIAKGGAGGAAGSRSNNSQAFANKGASGTAGTRTSGMHGPSGINGSFPCLVLIQK